MMDKEQFDYAGFWLRFIAYIIDGIIISFVEFLMVLPLLGFLGFNVAVDPNLLQDDDWNVMIPMILSAILGLSLSIFLITWLYYALMESSTRQATVGKMAVGIIVTDAVGNRISFAIASLRYFGKILSGAIFMIGYIMAGFTARKQALHDIIANTLVIRK